MSTLNTAAKTTAIEIQQDGPPRGDAHSSISDEVAQHVAATIQDAENLFDQALVAVGEYAMLLPSIRSETTLQFGAAQPAMQDAISALAKMAEARDLITSSHRHLNRLAKLEGLTPMSVGPWGRKVMMRTGR